jgi:hypothetical protein
MKTARMIMAVAAFTLMGAAAPNHVQNAPGPPAPSSAGTCQEECAWQCGELYPDDPNLRNLCTYSCIRDACGGADYP